MKWMRKIFIGLILIILLIGCAENEEVSNENEEDEEAAATETDNTEVVEEEEEENLEDIEEDINEETDESSLSEADIEMIQIDTVPIDSPFGDDGNIINEHTEQEIVEEFMDEDGRIYFDLNEEPIRSITSEDASITNITNYSDSFIEILEEEAYQITDSEMIEEAYELIISSPPEELRDLDREDYRTWEEATNLERGMIQVIYLSAPALNDLAHLIENKMYNHEAFSLLLAEFEKLGTPNLLIPAPQTPMDIQLYENMEMVKTLWGQLGQFEDPSENKDEFEELYFHLRQEMNNLIVRINLTLSEEF
jgi:hypothetical protein